jgi:transposase InsO family protein
MELNNLINTTAILNFSKFHTFKALNNHGYFTQERIAEMIAIIKTYHNINPNSNNNYGQKHYKVFSIDSQLEGVLFVKPSDAKDSIYRSIVPIEEKENVLKRNYYDITIGLRGRDIFYDKLKRSFVGISLRDITKFLKKQEVWQRGHKPRKQIIVRPIVAKEPYNHWQIDLIDVSRISRQSYNYNNNWIMTVIDLFSKFIYLEAMKNKEAKTTVEAFTRILAKAGGKPKLLQSDQGAEFKNDKFLPFLAKQGIKHSFSDSHKPQSQGAVERANGTVKQLLRKHFIACTTKNFTQVLEEIEYNINHSRHSTTKQIPAEIHFTEHEVLAYDQGTARREEIEEKLDQAHSNIQRRAEKVLEKRGVKTKLHPFKQGEFVRVQESVLMQKKNASDTWRAERIKAKLMPYYTQEVYTIKEVWLDGRIRLEEIDDKVFYPIDLMYVPVDTQEANETTCGEELYNFLHPTFNTVENPDQNNLPVSNFSETTT